MGRRRAWARSHQLRRLKRFAPGPPVRPLSIVGASRRTGPQRREPVRRASCTTGDEARSAAAPRQPRRVGPRARKVRNMSSSTRRRAVRAAWAVLTAASLVGVAAASTATALAGPATTTVQSSPVRAALVSDEYAQRFLAQYDKIKDPGNGYFSPQGIPYHSVETLIVEAPDHGHETTSEAYSYWIWLEALYGQVTGDWAPFNEAWETMEKYMIPQQADQPTNSFYNASKPGDLRARVQPPEQLPVAARTPASPSARTRSPASSQSTYGNRDIYDMHWLADVDNVYGYGNAPGAGCQLGPSHEGVSLHQHVPARGAGVRLGDGPAAVLRRRSRSAAPTATSTCSPGRVVRQAVEVHERARRRRARRRGRLLGQPVGDRAGQAGAGGLDRRARPPRWATTCGTRSSTSTSSRSAARRRRAPRAPARTARTTCCPGTTPWGGATDTNAGWAWRIGSSARATSATRTRSRPGRCRPTRP